MAAKPTKKPSSKAKVMRDLPLGPEKAKQVKGGKASAVLMKACATGTHMKEATII